MSNYRQNANDMSLAEQLGELRNEIAAHAKNPMSGEQQYAARMTRNVILGILGLVLLCGGMGYGCNTQDNRTKLAVAKQCPAVSPILAVGLTKAKE